MTFSSLMKALAPMVKNNRSAESMYLLGLKDAMGVLDNEGPRRINPRMLESVKGLKPLQDFPYDMDKIHSKGFIYNIKPGRRLDMIDDWIQQSRDKDLGGLWNRENGIAYVNPNVAPQAAIHELTHGATDAAIYRPKAYADLRNLYPFDLDQRSAYKKALEKAILNSGPGVQGQFSKPQSFSENMADAASLHFYQPDITQNMLPPEILEAIRTVIR